MLWINSTVMGKYLIPLGGILLLVFIFGVPAVLVPVTMDNIPERSRIKVLTLHQDVIDTVSRTFRAHDYPESAPGRVMPLPEDSMSWIKLINPMGRKAPGGGQAILFEADDQTGAIGLKGDANSVTIVLPAYAGLQTQETTITARSQTMPD